MNKKYSRLLKDTLIFAIGGFGSKLILFFLVPLYTNYLTQADYGISDLVFTFSQLLIPVFSLTIYNAVLRFGISKSEQKENVLVAGFFIFGIGSALCLAITPIFSLYAPLSEWKWYLTTYVTLSILNSMILNYIKVLGKNKLYAAISIIQTLFLALSNIALLVGFKVGIKGYLLSNIISVCVAIIVGFFASNIIGALKRGKLDFKVVKRMVAFSAPIIFNDLSWWLIHSTDKVMIQYMVSNADLGLYTVATKIPALINVIISIFSQAWGVSSILENESTNDPKFYSNIFRAYSFLAFGATVFLTLIIKDFMRIYVGSDFTGSWQYVPLLLASASFSAVSAFYGSLYGAFKRNLSSMVTTIIAAVVNIVLNYFFIKMYNIWGAVIGTVAAYVVIAVLRMIDTRKFIKFKIGLLEFCLNGAIVLAQTILVALGFNIYIVSSCALALFLLANIRSIKLFVTMIKDKFTKRKTVAVVESAQGEATSAEPEGTQSEDETEQSTGEEVITEQTLEENITEQSGEDSQQ